MTVSAWPRELAAILREIRLPAAPPADPRPLQLGLRDHLYRRGFSRPAGTKAAGGPPAAVPGLVRRLSAANRGRDTWLPGWRVDELGAGGKAVLVLGARRRAVEAGDYALTLSQDLPPRIGCDATLRHRRESLTLQAGVYYAFGDALAEVDDGGPALRVYLHAARESAVLLFEILTVGLNARQVPFTLKSMLRPEDADRSDATLLYLPPQRFPAFAELLRQAGAPLRAALEPEVPLFTKPLAPGIGLAESPVTGESFGMHRCRLVAEGVVEAWSTGRDNEESRRWSVERRFAAEGLSVAAPYLNPGSADVYEAEAS
jgi:hypothetical protein